MTALMGELLQYFQVGPTEPTMETEEVIVEQNNEKRKKSLSSIMKQLKKISKHSKTEQIHSSSNEEIPILKRNRGIVRFGSVQSIAANVTLPKIHKFLYGNKDITVDESDVSVLIRAIHEAESTSDGAMMRKLRYLSHLKNKITSDSQSVLYLEQQNTISKLWQHQLKLKYEISHCNNDKARKLLIDKRAAKLDYLETELSYLVQQLQDHQATLDKRYQSLEHYHKVVTNPDTFQRITSLTDDDYEYDNSVSEDNDISFNDDALMKKLSTVKRRYNSSLKRLLGDAAAYLDVLQAVKEKVTESKLSHSSAEAEILLKKSKENTLALEPLIRKYQKMKENVKVQKISGPDVMELLKVHSDLKKKAKRLKHELELMKIIHEDHLSDNPDADRNDATYSIQLLQKETQLIKIKQEIHSKTEELGSYADLISENNRTLRDWITDTATKTRSCTEIQNMLRLVAYGIASLHNNKIVHGELIPENIFIRPGINPMPILCDFEQSTQSTYFNSQLIAAYYAPELSKRGAIVTMESDIWAFAIMILELFCSPHPLVLSENNPDYLFYVNRASLKPEVVEDPDLEGLLKTMLCLHPKDRPTIADVLSHEFFSKDIGMMERYQLNQDVIIALKQYLKFKSAETYQKEHVIHINIENVVLGTLHVFASMTQEQLVQAMCEMYIGDKRKTTKMEESVFELFFKLVVSDQEVKLFYPFYGMRKVTYIPFPDDHNIETIRRYEALGKICAKAIFDGKNIPVNIASYVWRFLLLKKEDPSQYAKIVTMRDLDSLDNEYANHLRMIMTQTDVRHLYLDFSDVESGNATEVTNDNRQLYVSKCIQHRLILSRVNNLLAFRRGFRTIEYILPYLNLMHDTEIMHLVSKNQQDNII
jgi:serine/threonine protein kinase/molybdopterin converting factor small subunit